MSATYEPVAQSVEEAHTKVVLLTASRPNGARLRIKTTEEISARCWVVRAYTRRVEKASDRTRERSRKQLLIGQTCRNGIWSESKYHDRDVCGMAADSGHETLSLTDI